MNEADASRADVLARIAAEHPQDFDRLMAMMNGGGQRPGGIDIAALLKQIQAEMNPPETMLKKMEAGLEKKVEEGKKAGKIHSIYKNIMDLQEMQKGADAPYP